MIIQDHFIIKALGNLYHLFPFWKAMSKDTLLLPQRTDFTEKEQRWTDRQEGWQLEWKSLRVSRDWADGI